MSVISIIAGAGGAFLFNATISTNTSNYNLRTAAIGAGWNGTKPLKATITINSSVVVSGTGTGASSAFVVNNIPTGSSLAILNNGTVVGSPGTAGSNTTNSSAHSYPGNPVSVSAINYANAYPGTGYPTGAGAGGSCPGNNAFGGGTTGNGGSAGAGGTALYLASNITLTITNGSTGIFVGGGGGSGGQAGNNAGGGSGGNGGYCIEETGSHPAVTIINVAGGIVASGGGGSGGWGNRINGDSVGGKPGFSAINYQLDVGNFGGVGISSGLATNNTGTTLINSAGTFTASPAV